MRALFLFAFLTMPAAAQLAEVHTVYLLPMSNGLDQYLAHRLTASGVFRVVADPEKADAVFTDRLGEAFEAALDKLQPPPPVKEPAEEEKDEKDKDTEEEKTASVVNAPQPVRTSSFSRAKGTVFLVSVKSRDVVWSIFEQPRDTTPRSLDRTAERIAGELKKRLAGK